MRFLIMAMVAAMAASAPAAAQEFTSRALPPESLMADPPGAQPRLQSAVLFVERPLPSMVSDGSAPVPRSSLGRLESNVRCIAQAVYHEARGEVLAGQQAVADVVMNRVRSGRWSGDACGVIHAPGQFQNSSRWQTPRPGEPLWDRAIAVARAAAAGTVSVSSRLMSFRAGRRHAGVRIGRQVFF